MKRLSIITVNFNNGVGLRKTIQSIKNQIYTNFEFVVIDGGSTDSSLEVLKEYNSIINYSVSEADGGVYQAMNKGILKATGEYCLFLNSGDCLEDNKVLKNVFEIISDEDIVYGNTIKIRPHYRRLIKYSSHLTFFDFYKTEPAMHHQATFIKRNLFEQLGLYRDDIKIIADWEFFFRAIILKEVTTKYIDLTICTFDGNGLSNTLNENNPERINANCIKVSILKSQYPDFILDDYKKLNELLTHKTLLEKIVNKVAYFRLKR
jgi:glycosyltransferase involved in cell wall biosynthesis